MTQTELARRAECSNPHLSLILSGDKKPSWGLAKRLAAVTRTRPELWMDGIELDRLSAAVKRAK